MNEAIRVAMENAQMNSAEHGVSISIDDKTQEPTGNSVALPYTQQEYQEKMASMYAINSSEGALTHQQRQQVMAIVGDALHLVKGAAQQKPQSLATLGNNDLLEHLIRQENEMTPFYLELLKRLPRELQASVIELLDAKHFSLRVLAQLASSQSEPTPQTKQPVTEYSAPQQSHQNFATEGISRIASLNEQLPQNYSPSRPSTVFSSFY